jgi:hypothetical protein
MPCFEDPWKPELRLFSIEARLATLWVAGGPPETWTCKTWTYKRPASLPAMFRDRLDRTFLPN